jgi:hypothetical protein
MFDLALRRWYVRKVMCRPAVSVREVALAVAMFCIAASLYPPPAHAYLDAGTGSMIFQIVLASGTAAFFILKTRWREIKARLAGKPADPKPADPDSGPNAS